ncbi:fused signal recognition particle receptor [Rhizobium multihospitium]|uniref:Fused signal recognition particle receptor n=1 Tax=Rhizobium multihospitium TaxID=410764 RepID=A0A1C3U2H5_9HYPH|nr:fused signal recognition particle receptor [Rhizobium multihospitium]
MTVRGKIPPSVPSGHLPHTGGDHMAPLSPNSSFWFDEGSLLLQPISPLVGEMSAKLTEGGISPHLLSFTDTIHVR